MNILGTSNQNANFGVELTRCSKMHKKLGLTQVILSRTKVVRVN